MKSVDGYDSGVKKALSRVKGHLVGRPQFAQASVGDPRPKSESIRT
jgi:hypothetical protein